MMWLLLFLGLFLTHAPLPVSASATCRWLGVVAFLLGALLALLGLVGLPS